ncbi:sodium/potassium-transporting ATPase subunit beta-1-interacting protein isoform X3 [Cephus cinctus]|uniref:Sodium/potassium-transporting ATPase subunit beta-1-interacting protein n=1 Tax=Cephus cinctus TaxID=211228 RepID=A0AAJ7BJI3_CEPCN|nr:sodium/potassium-transporting ATPase subunit beta-1-interacting protein isoform X3 [Cephus cinctus]
MGICSRRHFLLTICTLQLITTIERQVFDFLGFMWAPILVNFFNIIFVILGFFGAFQYRPKYIISYCVWNTLWLGWNIFIVCFYLSVGILDKNSDILNLGTGSFSWWQINGPGCKAVYNVTDQELFRPARPTNVTDCVLEYEVIEVLHAATQCLLAFMAVVGGICLSRVFLEEDDSFDFVGGGDFGLAGHTPLHPITN